MGLIAAFLIPVVLFFWFAFCFTLWAWFRTIVCLFECKFTRAALWFNTGVALLLWWTNKWESWDHFLPGACFFIGLGALGTFVRYLKQTLPPRNKPFSPTGFGHKIPANDNRLVVFSVHAKNEG